VNYELGKEDILDILNEMSNANLDEDFPVTNTAPGLSSVANAKLPEVWDTPVITTISSSSEKYVVSDPEIPSTVKENQSLPSPYVLEVRSEQSPGKNVERPAIEEPSMELPSSPIPAISVDNLQDATLIQKRKIEREAQLLKSKQATKKKKKLF
jgi:hypothetical protein